MADLGWDLWITIPPFRQAVLPLQRRQSPAPALSKAVLHLRHVRDLR